ncbi:MAG: AMP-binding protein [Saprospiraceae bacterium]|nr:AMP-binding protein [Saprospiraceae bacterium]
MYETRPWLANYPQGMPANINPDLYENLVDFFDEKFVKYADHIAFECMGVGIKYKELDKLSRQFGAYLQSRGLEPGDKFAIMMPNCLQYPVALIGAMRAGLIIVNTNPLYTQREMLHQFTDSEVKGICILANFAHNLEAIMGKTKINVSIVTTLGEMLGPVHGFITDIVVKYIKKLVPKYTITNSVNFKEVLETGKKFTIKEFPNCSDDVVLHQYTGGTTGVAKGAMLTNRNLIANMLQSEAAMKVLLKEGEEVCLSPLPMYHIFAFTVNVLAMVSLGAKTVLVTNARDLKSVLKEFNKNKITLFTGLNTLFNALLNHPDFDKYDYSHLKVTVGGGMAVQVAIAEKWEKATGNKIFEGFGMTETSPVVCLNPLDGRVRYGSIGMPVSSTEVRIVDEDGNNVPVGERGELITKGPQVMSGYYNNEAETAKVLKDGWMYTGDIAIMEPDGYFSIVDRKKDMILVSGFNVYPNEVEDELIKHPKIQEVAAVGVPSEQSGECVKVFVVKKDQSLTKEEVIAYAKENLTGYKIPKEVEFRTELPKTNVGKILRRQLRDGK